MNSDKPEGKKRPVLLVPRCETCSKSTPLPFPTGSRCCNQWRSSVPSWGFCHQHPEVIAHA